MTSSPRVHPEAHAELNAGAAWYDEPAVGQQLIDAAREAVALIVEMPSAWPPDPDWDGGEVIRRKSVKGFPYGVIYYVAEPEEEIVIVAYAHNKRRPGYWKGRI